MAAFRGVLDIAPLHWRSTPNPALIPLYSARALPFASPRAIKLSPLAYPKLTPRPTLGLP